MSSDDIEILWKNYSKCLTECVGRLEPAFHQKDSEIDIVCRTDEDTLQNLDLLLEQLRQYSPRTQSVSNFINFKDILKTIVDEKRRSRDLTCENKEDKQMAKKVVDEKLVTLKRDIEQIVEDNHRMESELQEDDSNKLPLLLRLMSSRK